MATFDEQAVRIDGLNELRRAFRNAPKELKNELKGANKQAAETVRGQARIEVPRRSGRLAASITATGSLQYGTVSAGSKGRAPHAAPIHWGWPSRPNPAKRWRGGPIARNPFISRALHVKFPQVVEDYADAADRLAAKLTTD